jgi:hypothetical protein
MFKKEEEVSKINKCNAHVANQFKVITSNFKENNSSKAWPKAFSPFVSDQKTFPKSWSQFPLSPSY